MSSFGGVPASVLPAVADASVAAVELRAVFVSPVVVLVGDWPSSLAIKSRMAVRPVSEFVLEAAALALAEALCAAVAASGMAVVVEEVVTEFVVAVPPARASRMAPKTPSPPEGLPWPVFESPVAPCAVEPLLTEICEVTMPTRWGTYSGYPMQAACQFACHDKKCSRNKALARSCAAERNLGVGRSGPVLVVDGKNCRAAGIERPAELP